MFLKANHNFKELSVAKFNSSFLKCKRDESLECISLDGKNLGTFKKNKNKKDEQEQIGFVHMKSVTNVSVLLFLYIVVEIINFLIHIV